VKAAAKAAKPAPKNIHKTALKRDATPEPRRLHGKTEILACREGTEDRHARIAVVLVGGKTDSFAYYSKWKPRTCSIYVKRRHDSYSKWLDKGNLTTIRLEHGTFLIDHGKGTYRFTFKDVDRERYCGMDGEINGTLTIRKGSERCELAGIMEEGTALGQAYAKAPDEPAPAAAPAAAEAPRAPDRIAQRPRRPDNPPFPSASVGISD
jgi:hypothetical protein